MHTYVVYMHMLVCMLLCVCMRVLVYVPVQVCVYMYCICLCVYMHVLVYVFVSVCSCACVCLCLWVHMQEETLSTKYTNKSFFVSLFLYWQCWVWLFASAEFPNKDIEFKWNVRLSGFLLSRMSSSFTHASSFSAAHLFCRNSTALCRVLNILSSCSVTFLWCHPLISCVSFHSELSDHSLRNPQRPQPRWCHKLFKPCFSCALLLPWSMVTHLSRGDSINGPPQLNPKIHETRHHPAVSFHPVPRSYRRALVQKPYSRMLLELFSSKELLGSCFLVYLPLPMVFWACIESVLMEKFHHGISLTENKGRVVWEWGGGGSSCRSCASQCGAPVGPAPLGPAPFTLCSVLPPFRNRRKRLSCSHWFPYLATRNTVMATGHYRPFIFPAFRRWPWLEAAGILRSAMYWYFSVPVRCARGLDAAFLGAVASTFLNLLLICVAGLEVLFPLACPCFASHVSRVLLWKHLRSTQGCPVFE